MDLVRRIVHFLQLQGLSRQRWQIWFLMRKEILAPHRRTSLGWLWAIILPLVPVTAYLMIRLIIQGSPGPDGIKPVIYVVLGVTLWLLYRDLVRVPVESVVKYASTIANTELTVTGAILVGFGGVLVDTLLRMIVCAVAIAILSEQVSLNFFDVLVYFIASVIFFFSFGLMSVPIASLFPDLRNIYNTFFTYLIFFSLAIFPFDTTEGMGRLIAYNPFAVFIDSVRSLLLLGRLPDQSIAPILSISAILTMSIAIVLVTRTRHHLIEALQ